MSQTLTTPGLLRRLAAIGYDSLLVFSLLFGATWLYHLGTSSLLPAAGTGDQAGGLATGEVVTAIEPVASGPAYNLFLLLVMMVFFTWFWKKSGQTLGMQAWRLRIDNLEGDRISYPQALLRYACAWLSALCFGLGYLWILVDPEQRSWHDKASRSKVVLLPKKKK